VVEDDTLWHLARRFSTTVEAISSANGISEGQFLRPGQRLRIPTGRRVAASGGTRAPAASTYTVRSGDTLWAIALKTGVDVDTLGRANGIRDDVLRVGQRLVVPAPGSAVSGQRPAAGAGRQIATRRAQASVRWPARGVLTSGFGMRWRRHHNGIDIAAPRGTPIYAARDGRVVRAAWFGGYGRLVVVDHGDGMQTWYAHASRMLVRVGQHVKRGQQIATVGCTGVCSGPHLHFEVRIGGRPVDPLRHLR
jgi:murein DD-endopeptidase MepM/ murein hydrolase activator NlpD